jgi:hypothetical protein
VVCAGEPLSYSLAEPTSANVIGYKAFDAGNCFAAPAAGTPDGRMVTSAEVIDGVITNSGTASWWAVVDDEKVFAHGELAASQVVQDEEAFTLTPITVHIPGTSS